jgi:hypothetical protein
VRQQKTRLTYSNTSGIIQEGPAPEALIVCIIQVGRPVLWFWGHEHRMAGYHPQGSEKIQAHGRCIGHGGMPVERPGAPDRNQVAFFDNRVYSVRDKFGWNGYVTLEFDDAKLNVGYWDIGAIKGGGNQQLIEEEWTVDAQGQLSLTIHQKCFTEDFYGPEKWGR